MRSTKEETRKLEDCVCRWRGDFLTKFAQMLEFDAFTERKLSHLTFYCVCEHNTAIFSFCFFFFPAISIGLIIYDLKLNFCKL